MSDCITTTKQSTTEPCAYFLEYTVDIALDHKMSRQMTRVTQRSAEYSTIP